MPEVMLRNAVPADAELITRLIHELGRFEKAAPGEVKVTAEDVRRHGFGPRPIFETIIAEVDDKPVGFALIFHNFSTWEGRPGIYLEDLFVLESARGLGVGFALLRRVAEIAVERGCARMDFAVLDWNPARDFYEKLGAVHMSDWCLYRLTGDALARLART
jgi:GNAT superfamily N-acetyltransferase